MLKVWLSMKVMNLSAKSKIYTSNVYLLTGDWKAIKDINTLIDVGRDPRVIDEIYQASTGVGKAKVERVILTHNHYDHTSILPQIKSLFKPQVFAYSSSLEGVDNFVKGGERINIADRTGEVIHTPGHSNDSICLYFEEEGILFAGDTPLIIHSPGNNYEPGYIKSLEYICRKNINTIYFGHGSPLIHHCNEVLQETLRNVRKSQIA
jgi:glyoxylase-like metal-dependent hydrolase (beta-lactamase superfamily II)